LTTITNHQDIDWSRQTVLVTGAGGFIGSHLAERLATLGANTRALVHYNSTGSRGWLDQSPVKGSIEVFAGEIRDPDSLKGAFQNVDIVFHLAALIAIPYSYQAPLSFIRTNIEGTYNVLQASQQAGVSRVIQTSTSEVYGSARAIPMSEDHSLQAQSPYAASKVGSDKLAEAFHLSYGVPVSTVRPFNTYGPRQSARAVIPAIITQALTAKAVSLGNLSPTRDFNFVADTVEGFIKVAQCKEAVGEIINLGSGKEISIGDLAKQILALAGKDIPIISDPERARPEGSEVDRLCADNSKAYRMTGWRPQHSLEEGLQETFQWIQSHIEGYRTGVYEV
jgi:NAD dependent epimerase/dehydratase